MKTQFRYFALLISLLGLLNACSVVHKNTGDILISYAEDQGVPYMLQTDDVAMGCSMVNAFSPFLLSFSRVTTPPEQLAIMFYLMAGSCAEFDAWEEELRYLRAIHAKNSIEAQDARIAQQRLLSLAAQRQLKGYQYLVSAIAEPGGECPELATSNDQLYWLIGLLDGMQAIMNDVASGGNVKVPLNIAAKIGRGAACLDNQRWWGVPDAIQAAIWITIPGNDVVDRNPEQVLKKSLEIGLQQGVRLSQVLAAQVYLGQGNISEVKNIIREQAKLTTETSENKVYQLLDQVSILQIQAISDRLWTQATGLRTPIGKTGSFWDDTDELVETIDIDALL